MHRLHGALVVLFVAASLLLFSYHDSLPNIKGLSRLGIHTGHGLFSEHKTALEVDPPPTSPPLGAVVIASGADTDLSWTPTVKANWTVYEYDVRRPNHEDPQLRFPASKGNEAMIYLTFIIDNYENLPWCAIFMHGHPEAWHQEDQAARLIVQLNRVALARQGYISLRCEWYPSCPAEMHPVQGESIVWGPGVHTNGTEAALAGNWRILFPGEKLPETIASPCCAQFAVTRQAIIKRPREDYERMREWLLDTLLEDDLSGRVMEKLWAYIFTGDSVHCPPPETCACDWFGRCADPDPMLPAGGSP